MAVLLKHAGWVCVRFSKNADEADEVTDHHTFKNLISKISEYRVQMNYKTCTARLKCRCLAQGSFPSHMTAGETMAPGFELVTLKYIDFEFCLYFYSHKLNQTKKEDVCFFFKGQRKDSPVLSSLMRKAGIIRRTDVKPRPKTTSGQAVRQEGRRTGKDCRASENGKLPGLYNQLGTFDQPEPRHQLLWDNRQPSEGWRAAGTVGTTGQWPAGKGLVNKAHRAKSRRCPSMKCCMKAAKRTSSTVKQLFPSCRLSTVALSQARHPSPQTARWWRNGAMVGSVWTCYCTCLGFLTHFPLQRNILNIRRANVHTHAARTPVPVILW